MPKKRYSSEQIIVKLREAEVLESKGKGQLEIARKLGIAEQTDQTPKLSPHLGFISPFIAIGTSA
jgi:DNA-binding CsgD family transcriptional regulator